MNKSQIRATIKLLKSSDREPLKKIFESGGYLWATDGYVAFEICEVKDEFKGKCIPLDNLIAWNATHTKKTDRASLAELAEDNADTEPNMPSILHNKEWENPEEVRINIDFLKLACDFLGIKSVGLLASGDCYKVEPRLLDEMDIMTRAMESKAYVMGLTR